MGHIYLSTFFSALHLFHLCLTIPWPWWTISILEVTQSCWSGNCGNKLAGKKPGMRKAALRSHKISSFYMPNARAQSAFHCCLFGTILGMSERDQNSELRAHMLCWCKFCTSSHSRTTDYRDRIRLNRKTSGKPCLFQYLEQKLNAHISILLQCRDETTMTGDRIVQ